MMQSRVVKLLTLIVAGSAVGLVASAAAADTAPPSTATKIKPDLMVGSVQARQVGIAAEGAYQVRVSARVDLRAAGDVSTGPFKVKLEYRDEPLLSVRRMTKSLATWTFLQQAGITGMSYRTTSRRLPSETRTFDDTVPPGVVRTYRATVDSMDQVDEVNESNNQATDDFRADGCAGVDLVVQRVEIRRTDRGTFGKVWVKNRCLATCEGTVQWSPTLEPSPSYTTYTDVGQVITSRLAGEATAESPNWMNLANGDVVADPASAPPPEYVVHGEPERDQTWAISVLHGFPPGCTETNTDNNTCRVVLRAGADSASATCGR